MALFVLECDLMQQIKQAYETDEAVKELIEELKSKPFLKKHFSWSHNILKRKS